MTRWNVSVSVLALVSSLIGLSALAQPAPLPVVLVVDMQRVLQEAQAAISVRDQLAVARADFQQQIAAEESRLRAAEQELSAQRTILSAEAFAQKQQEMRRQFITVERQVQARRRALEEAFNDGMGVVRRTLLDVISQLASQRQARLVITRQQALWHDPALDMTDTVLAQLNAALPSVPVTVALPAVPAPAVAPAVP